jgi:hypothetical protein
MEGYLCGVLERGGKELEKIAEQVKEKLRNVISRL